jgi:hypothetical protein
MVKYSDYVLKVFGGPGLSKLHSCGATELPNLPNYFESALWTYIAGLIPNLSVFHIELTFLRRAGAAAEEYEAGRKFLLFYIAGIQKGEHSLSACHSEIPAAVLAEADELVE